MEKKKPKIPKGVAATLNYALDILAADYAAHESDPASVKEKERDFMEEIHEAVKWLDKHEVSK